MGTRKQKGLTPEQFHSLTVRLNEFTRFRSTAAEREPFSKVEDAFHIYLLGRFNDTERYAIVEANRHDIRVFQAELDAGAGRKIWPKPAQETES